MTFRAILLFVFGFQSAGTMPLNRFQLTLLSANDVAARANTANNLSTVPGNGTRLQSHVTRKHIKQESQTQTLNGTVEWEYKPLSWDCDVPNCDHFALYDDATQTNYELDDARAALPFEGKRAKVTGVMNKKDSIIHVISIEGLK